jgi:hypothetical protein
MLRRLSDPTWFQAFGCVLGFDWHSSGLTTVTCGAIKEAYRGLGADLGIHVAGGKGGASRKTPEQIADVADQRSLDGDRLIYASRMSAKVDSAAVQDGFDVYAHSFFFTDAGDWCVVQQGMNDTTGYARRYHWLADAVEDFVCEPHAAVQATRPDDGQMLLNMVAAEAADSRQASTETARMHPDKLLDEITAGPTLFMPAHHPVLPSDVDGQRLAKIMRTYEDTPPQTFEQLLGLKGVGPKTIRSLALIAELIYDKKACRRDPATFSYAHGGKDGFPFPVERAVYDQNIAFLEDAVRRARINPNDKDRSLRRLNAFVSARSD